MPEIVPPVAFPPTDVLVPSPFTVKLPEVFFKKIPLGPPVVETLVSATTKGVVEEAREISTADAPLVLSVPLVVVMVFVLSVATNAF